MTAFLTTGMGLSPSFCLIQGKREEPKTGASHVFILA